MLQSLKNLGSLISIAWEARDGDDPLGYDAINPVFRFPYPFPG